MPFTYFNTPVGIAKITEDDGFISAVSILDGDYATTPPASDLIKLAISQLDEYFAGERKTFTFPIKQNGSDFQQRVWQQLLQIPYGSTITYLQQAKQMNDPLAIRAIAAANGKNHLWVVVPCHRVIGSNGSLTGYAGGLWRKQWLLRHEAKVMGVGQAVLDL